jgi:FtsP/CotA-like multicopper oxidase with cupredoxin domain
MPTRRTLLKWSAVAAATTLIPAGGLAGYVWSTAAVSNVGRVRFARPLAIPPLAGSRRTAAGTREFPLRLAEGHSELLPGHRATTWGVNGPHLGPTLRIGRGEVMSPTVTNDLPESTTLHWHGMELPAEADGGPHQMISPGQEWRPSWRVDQPAATLWYHPHPHGRTKEHVYRGVAGMLLVDDPDADLTGVPRDYGIDDIPLVIQDKNFTEDGQLDLDGIAFGGINITGLLGREILVNGTWGPYLEVRAERTRLRILNASNARVYDLAFEDGRRFAVIAGDCGLLPAPAETARLLLSPGERAEIVVEMTPGETVRLRSLAPELSGNPLYDRLAGGADEFEILEVRAAEQLRPSPPLPARLPAAPDIPDPESGREPRLFRLGHFLIDGDAMDMDHIDAVVRIGSSEIWEVRNGVGVPHNFHIHNAAFEILDIDGAAPDSWLARQEGHGLHAGRRHREVEGRVRAVRGRRSPVHVPLPPPLARGRGNDGAVPRRRRAQPGAARTAASTLAP